MRGAVSVNGSGSGKFLNGLRGLVLIPSPRPSPGGRGSIAY